MAFAFRAAKMPKGCDNPLFDYGINLGLWNAALECLVRPREKQSDKHMIFDLLEARKWTNRSLTRRKKMRLGKKDTRSLNFIQICYNDIRAARNDFLHGNKVSMTSPGGSPIPEGGGSQPHRPNRLPSRRGGVSQGKTFLHSESIRKRLDLGFFAT
jgi:hypothetical protein